MTGTLQVDPSNAEQARAWDGDEGAYWAEHADRFDRSLRGYRGRLLEAAAVRPADRVLDVGCGAGEITCEVARRAPEGRVLGVDLSAAMLRVARRRAAEQGLANVGFEQADAQIRSFPPREFDLAVSRTGTMFFADHAVAFRTVARAVRPGGRFVQLVWQPPPLNEWFLALTTAMAAGRDLPAPPPDGPGPFSLSDPDRVRRLLTGAGFTEPRVEPLTAPMHFGSDADDAHRFVSGLLGWMLADLDDSGRARALADLRTTLRAHETSDGVLYPSATWLITATRA
ncbi:class I SAM-dependent methyltransferase [Kitasatospora sp. DSM 101779]|uniref:class I SAM-dependent methyltransferase n=1 Tax=Kitasatospora sp. DSM 101779 TaxID=2853165 RepID=UPI0021D85F0A|nr:methyltransferase domain-containing protein [Kitasatospora sp. DSM 101779]MCU7821065.1 methyltransferase domain-containing protein [Kitasatospora sp. DSM 101779]